MPSKKLPAYKRALNKKFMHQEFSLVSVEEEFSEFFLHLGTCSTWKMSVKIRERYKIRY